MSRAKTIIGKELSTFSLLAVCACWLHCPTAEAVFKGSVQVADSTVWCVVLEAERISGALPYRNGTTKAIEWYHFTLDEDTVESTGNCEAEIRHGMSAETLEMSFLPANFSSQTSAIKNKWSLSFAFENPKQSSLGESFRLADLNLTVVFHPDLFNLSNIKGKQEEIVRYRMVPPKIDSEWAAVDDHLFSCSTAELALVPGEGSIKFEGLRVVAFALLPSDNIPTGQTSDTCRRDLRTGSSVPAVVGVCLFLLLLGVAGAYYWGWRNAPEEGYISV